MKKIILFGGTFDPVHYGHLILAEHAIEFFNAQKVIFIPNYKPPHKVGYIPTHWQHRLNMLNLAIQNEPKFEISTYEIDQKKVSYTYLTTDWFFKKYNNTELFFLIGLDSLLTLTSWQHWENIISKVCFIVGERVVEEKSFSKNIHTSNKIICFNSPKIEISSSEIRARVKNRKTIKFLVPDLVEEYIVKQKLYK